MYVYLEFSLLKANTLLLQFVATKSSEINAATLRNVDLMDLFAMI